MRAVTLLRQAYGHARRVAMSEGWLLFAALAAAVAAWGFIELSEEVLEGDTRAFDRAVLAWFRDAADPSKPVGPVWLAESMRDITALGSVAVLLGVTLAVLGYLLFERKYHAAVLVLVATVGGQVISSVLKALFDRDRPDVVPHLAEVLTASFPSGHSMLSAVVYLTLGALLARLVARRRVKVYFIAVAMLATVMIGLSRVYLGVHYPTDVLAGWSLGLAWATVCWLTARYLQRRGAVEREGEETDGPEGEGTADRSRPR